MKVIYDKDTTTLQEHMANALLMPDHAIAYDPLLPSRCSIKERVTWFWKLHHWRTIVSINLHSERVYISKKDWNYFQGEIKEVVAAIEKNDDSIRGMTIEVRP